MALVWMTNVLGSQPDQSETWLQSYCQKAHTFLKTYHNSTKRARIAVERLRMASVRGSRDLPCTLERFQDDETARAPEPSGATTSSGFGDAPELDCTSSTPQVSNCL